MSFFPLSKLRLELEGPEHSPYALNASHYQCGTRSGKRRSLLTSLSLPCPIVLSLFLPHLSPPQVHPRRNQVTKKKIGRQRTKRAMTRLSTSLLLFGKEMSGMCECTRFSRWLLMSVMSAVSFFFSWFPSITIFNPCSASAPTDVLPCLLLMKSLGLKASPKSLSMSVTTVPPTPSEMALFEGKQTNNFLGTLSATTVLSQPTAAAVPPPSKHLSSTLSSATDTSSLSNSTLTTNVVDDDSDHNPITMREIGSKSLGVCFVAEGTFDILVEVVEVSEFGLALPLLEKTTTKKVVRVVVEREED